MESGKRKLPNLYVLFQPFRFESLQLKNRIVMAPMTRGFSPEGIRAKM
jgi:2,4-dienoyl-CoA reductase-like NADH-dependent reductase (Old Yellow Enzyme family)